MSTSTIIMLAIYVVVFGGASVFLVKKSLASKSEGVAEEQDGFASRIGYVLSAVGAAVGVGAMWRFPMLCAQWGGGAFVLAFVVVSVIIVIPAGWAEIAFARHVGKGLVGIFGSAAGKPGKGIGWIMSADQLCLWAYYPAIMALLLAYIGKTLFNGLNYAEDAEVVYEATNGSRFLMYGLVLVILIVTAFITSKGIANGIEKCCKIMLPTLIVILVLLAVRVCFIPGIAEGIEFYAHPDLSQLKNPEMWASATGMALFAVGLGPGPLSAYGRFVNKKQDIATDFITINVIQISVCLLAGFVIIPAVQVFGLDPLMGKGITFVALPKVFAQFGGGSILLVLFYIALLFAGISSSINQLEVGINAMTDKEGLGMSRFKAICTAFVIAAVIAIPCVWNDAFFAVFDNIIGNIGYCVCAFLVAVVLGWKVGAKKIRTEMYLPTSEYKWGAYIDVLYKYAVPLVFGYFTIVAIASLF